MNALVVANIDEATTTSEFLKSQRELVDNIYSNDNTYLSAAQEMSDSYMQMKQRIPMVMEYYQTPEEIKTIEMYINPEKLTFQNTKVIGKQYTRGGIFFHHYGEDTPTMQISGSTGMSGMRAIEQLEKIFNYSGTLLKYQNIGINKINNGKSERRQILDYHSAVTGFDEAANSEELTALSETYNEIVESANILIDGNSGLLSEEKAMLLISKDLKLLYTEKIFSKENADVKVIAQQTIDALQSKEYHSFNEIFDIAKKYTKKSSFNDSTANAKDIIDEVAFQIAFDIYQSSYDKLENVTLADGDVANNGEIVYVNNTYCIYKCVNLCYSYSGPSYSSKRLDYLSVNGQFTGKKETITDDFWVQHINGSWAKIKDDQSNNWRVLTKEQLKNQENLKDKKVYLYSNDLIVQLDEWEKEGINISEINKLTPEMDKNNITILKEGGTFTSDKEHIVKIKVDGILTTMKFIRHIKQHKFKNKMVYAWTLANISKVGNNISTFNEYLTQPLYLELLYNNVKFYTVVKEGVYLYNSSNTASGKLKNEPLVVGGKFTAVDYCGDWIKHINGGWAMVKKDGVTYIQEGFSDDKENNDENNKNNKNSNNEIKTNNNITTVITDVRTKANTALQKYLTEVREWNKNSVIKRWEIESGFADIQDELTDEWRPRLIFIYFEDRVYIGHFENFNYDRVAQTENITYTMTFVIQRIISVTSISPNRFEQEDLLDHSEVWDDENMEYANNLEYYKAEYAKGNDVPLKIAILRTRCIFYREQVEADRSGIPMTKERKDQLHGWAVKLRACSIYNGKQQIVESTPIYGNVGGGYDIYVRFIQLQYIMSNGDFTTDSQITTEQAVKDAQINLQLLNKINGEIVTVTDIQTDSNLALLNDVIEPELARVRKVWDEDKKLPTYTQTRKKEIYEHVNKLLYAVGARYCNNSDFKTLRNNWLYIRQNSNSEIGVITIAEVMNKIIAKNKDDFKDLCNKLITNNFNGVDGYISFKASDYNKAWRANQISQFINDGSTMQISLSAIIKGREDMLYMKTDYYEKVAKKLINYL